MLEGVKLIKTVLSLYYGVLFLVNVLKKFCDPPCLPVLNARAHGGVFVAAVSEYSLLNEWPDGWR